MANSLNSFSTRPGRVSTPQTEQARADQVRNNAGGYVFSVSDLDRVKRFLILGSESNFYQSGQSLTKENATVIIAMAQADSKSLVDLIVEISTQGRAAKQQPGLFALAIAASYGSTEDKKYALSKLSEVARTASTLFTFLSYVQQFRGWGRALQRAVANWYHDKPTEGLSYQIAKYKSRDGFSHRDVFRLSHLAAKIVDRDGVEKAADRQALGEYVLRDVVNEATPKILQGVERGKTSTDVPAIVTEFGLTWEMLPSEELNNAEVWTALLDGNVPLGALLRQLPRLTNLGLLAPGTPTFASVMARLTNEEDIKRARIHPVNVLVALKTYAGGRSLQGKSTWTPVGRVVDALDEMFYKSFQYVQPTGKRYLIGLDVSGSMIAQINGSPLTSYEAEAGIAMTLVQTEENVEVVGFTTGQQRGGSWTPPSQSSAASRNFWGYRGTTITPLPFGRRQRLDDVLQTMRGLPFGGTDCAATFQYATALDKKVDTFITITDNETYAGGQHAHEALEAYRVKSGIRTRSIVLGTQASEFTIADPNDPLQLDVAGFDSAVPSIISEFSKGI